MVITMVNYIKPHPLHTRLFAKLGADMGSEYENVLFHTEARWLSRGNVWERFIKLRNKLFGCEKKTDFVDFLCQLSV